MLHPDHAEAVYSELIREYQQYRQPVVVDFRAAMPGVSAHDRATHLMHSYPAKLLRHIPALLVRAPQLSSPGNTVMDPFCGSGTVLVEGVIAGRKVIGSDSNPFAAQLSRVKVTLISRGDVAAATRRLFERLDRGPGRVRQVDGRLAYWFSARVASELCAIADAVSQTRRRDLREFFEICLSSCARRVSLADPRISVPVRLKSDQYPADHWLAERTKLRLASLDTVDVRAVFQATVKKNAARLESLSALVPEHQASHLVETADVRRLQPREAPIDLIVTSPPYLGAQKYIRATSLSLLWLGLADGGDLRPFSRVSIGRDYFRQAEIDPHGLSGLPDADAIVSAVRVTNPLRAHLAVTYLQEMRQAIRSMSESLRDGGHMVLVAGGNTLCGHAFDTPSYLEQLACAAGLTTELVLTDTIRSRGLMTRRNRAASPITQESVFVMRKPAA